MRLRRAVVINALSAQRGGVRTYLRNILPRIPEALGFRVIVLADTRSASSYDFPNCEVVECRAASGSVLKRTIWEQVQLPRFVRRVSASVLLCPGGMIPRGVACRTAIVWRNMLPFQPREILRYGPSRQLVRLLLLRGAFTDSMRRADLVICLSEFAREVLEAGLPHRNGRIAVIPNGVAEAFRESGPSKPAGLPADYFLYVSTVDVYKAHLQVVEAWRAYKHQSGDRAAMVFLGPEYRPYADRVRRRVARYGLEESVIFAGLVDHEKLPGIYSAARAHVFASSCESCPTILLEMLGSGRPVICSSYRPMPEFGADAAVYFDPYNPRELTAWLLRWPDLDEYGRQGRERSLAYAWDRVASLTWEELGRLADGNRG